MAIKKSKYFFEDELIETIGEVSDEKYKRLPENEKLKFIGKKIPRYDGYVKASGKAKYTFDIELPNMVYGKTLRSPFPNATIKAIHISKAKRLKGVLDVLTYENSPKIEWYGSNGNLFDKNLRYNGDEVAFVVAKSEKIAEKACKYIQVEYEEKEFSTSALESFNNNTLKIHEWGNVVNGKPDLYERGNIEEGFANSDVIVEETFTTEVALHNPTEPHCSVVKWEGNKLYVWDSTQGVFAVRNKIADVLGISEEDVIVKKEFMGGGFGGKLEAGKYTVMAALASKKLKRPVKVRLDRIEMNLAVGNRPDSVQELKIGFKKDGTLNAMSHKSFASVGAYPTGGGCSWPVKTIYKCENVKTIDYSIITNTGKARPFRAPGHVQGFFGLDSIIDMAAEKLGMDPLELRLKNYADNDQVWGLTYTSKLLKEAYNAGAEKIGWKSRNNLQSKNRFVKRGMGMASQIWWGGGGPPAHSNLELNSDGEFTLLVGSQDLGTGTYTIVAQVAAEILEVPFDSIKVILGDTSKVPYGPSSGGSTTAASITPAVRDASEKMIEKIVSTSQMIVGDGNDVKYQKGRILVNGSEELSLSEILKKLDTKKLVTYGSREENLKGFITQSFGAQFADVEVDTLTGNVKVLKIVAAHDIGRTLNRQTLENQFQGGIMQGLGFALMEERMIDPTTGKVLNTNLHDYKMPTMLDTPNIDVIIVSKLDEKANNMGVKGIGEPAIIPTAAAIANAVSHAIGVRIKSLPITPDKILNALNY